MNGRSRWVGMALVAVAFLTGGVAGMALDRTLRPGTAEARGPESVESRGGPDRGGRGSFRGPGGIPDRLPILDELDLTEAQRTEVDSILESGRRHVTTLWREQESTFRAAMDSTQARINAILTPEQREEYQERVREYRSRRRGSSGGDSGRPGPPPPPR